MELMEEYKQTDIGEIPFDWDIHTLKNVANYRRGSFPQPYGLAKWYDDVNGSPFVQVFDVSDNGLIKQETKRRISKVAQLYSVFAGKGTLILTIQGSIGRIAITQYDAFIDRTLLIFENYKLPIDVGYFAQTIKTLFKREEKNAPGGIIKTITKEALSSFLIPLPPTKAEQTAIATAIGDMDALIARLEKLIEKKKDIKQGAIQQLIKPKEGWVLKKLGDLLDYEQPTNYLVSDTEYNNFNQIPVLTAGKTFILGYTNEEHGIFNKLPIIIFDDFTTAIKYVDFPFKAKSSAMKMLLPKNENVNLRYVYEIMQQLNFPLGDHKRHWIGEFSHFEIHVPQTPEEQDEIATILSDMDNEIQSLEHNLSKYQLLKQGMMQELLTGKTRLI